MDDAFMFREFSNQGRGQTSQEGRELHSMPQSPVQEDLPEEMQSVIEEGRTHVKHMLRNGSSCESIAEATKLPLDYVVGIQAEMKADRQKRAEARRNEEDSAPPPVNN